MASRIVSDVEVGETFDIVIELTTRQPGPLDMKADVALAYVDAMFDRAMVDVTAANVTSTEFNLDDVNLEPWGFNELGGNALTAGGESDGVQTLARISAVALAAGEFTVDASVADDDGNVFRFVGETEVINPLRVDFNSESLTILDPANPMAEDLVAFAQAIADSGAVFYGAAWCRTCTAQKQLFEDGARYLPFVEVTNPDRSRNQIAIDNEISIFPTWEFADGTRHEGMLSLEELSTRSGIEIPTGNAPHIAQPILAADGAITVLAGSPLHIPLDGYDPNGDPLTYTVTTDDSSVVVGELREENRRMRIKVPPFGDMVFHLFDEEVPRVIEQITSLAESGFYDGITFHRVIDNFVIQGGDPTGTGSGGSNLPDFDDQFDLDLQHNRDGVLSMAKAEDDSNNSQFFITDAATRHLDFNHSIFGQLIEGNDVRDAINSTATLPGDRPALPVTMESVDVFEDQENGMLRLFANADSIDNVNLGITTIHVTAEDVNGNSSTISFDVFVNPDDSNSPPYLRDIPEPIIADGGVVVELDAVDAEGDPFTFDARVVSGNADIDVNADTGRLFVTSQDHGVVEILARVGSRSSFLDEQRFEIDFSTINVGEPTIIDLLAASDTGFSQNDNITSAEQLMIAIPDSFVGQTIQLRARSIVIASQTIDAPNTVITVDATTLSDGMYELSAFDVSTAESFTGFSLTIDRTAPVAIGVPAIHATVGEIETVDLQHPEEGAVGFEYGDVPGNPLFFIDNSTGLIRWLPLTATERTSTMNVSLTDAAGNETIQPIVFDVAENSDPIINLIGFANENGAEFFFDESEQSEALQLLFDAAALDILPIGNDSGLPEGSFPAIRFDGDIATNMTSIEEIADFVGFDLSTEPPLVLTDITIPTSSAKIIPLGSSSDPVRVRAVDNGDVRSTVADVHMGNPHLRLDVAGYGTMVFEIFKSHVPELAKHLAELVQSGHYDGLEFYRVNGDLIQAGDPSNLALSAQDPNSVDDQFHSSLRHGQAGVLSMAKLVDDGIGDSFFVTSRAIPEFDFHYSIVGRIVEGDEVQASIEAAQTVVGGFPKDPIVITSATISFDPTRATLFVSSTPNTGEAEVSLIRGGVTETFNVTVEANPNNSGPYIDGIVDFPGAGSAKVFATDNEGDPIRYHAGCRR